MTKDSRFAGTHCVCRAGLKQLYDFRRDKIDDMTPGRTDIALASLAPENTSDELTVVQWDINFLRRTFG